LSGLNFSPNTKKKKCTSHFVASDCRQVCADIAETSVTVDARERYQRMLRKRRRNGGEHFKADFIAADCTKTRLFDLYPRKVVFLIDHFEGLEEE
jgi:hypothetical protein